MSKICCVNLIVAFFNFYCFSLFFPSSDCVAVSIYFFNFNSEKGFVFAFLDLRQSEIKTIVTGF